MPTNAKQKIEDLVEKVDEIIDHQKKIEKKEEAILDTVATDEKEDKEIVTEVEQVAESEANSFQRMVLTKAKKHEILYPLIALVGVVLVWRGLWDLFDQVPILSYALTSLVVGLIILWLFNRIRSL